MKERCYYDRTLSVIYGRRVGGCVVGVDGRECKRKAGGKWWFCWFWWGDSAESSDFVSKAIDVATKELIVVATNGEEHICFSVNQVQLDRAKQSTESAILMNLESYGCFRRYR